MEECLKDPLNLEYFVSQYEVLDCRDTDYPDLLEYLTFLLT